LAEYHHGADIEGFKRTVARLEGLRTRTKVTKEELLMKVCMQDYPMTPKEKADAEDYGKSTAASVCGGAPSP